MTQLVENNPHAWSERASLPASHQAAMWSEGGQTRRFLAVLRHLELREGDTFLDFGCGTGRLCEFLPVDILYHGYDWAPGMVERVALEHPRAVTFETLPEELFDHVVCIGTFNLRDGWTKEQTFERLTELWTEQTRRTLAASLYRGHDPMCWRYEPEELAEFARRMGCAYFAIDAIYAENDVTLVLHR